MERAAKMDKPAKNKEHLISTGLSIQVQLYIHAGEWRQFGAFRSLGKKSNDNT